MNFLKPNSDHTKRREDSTEYLTSLSTFIVGVPVMFYCPPLAVVGLVSVVCCAYMVSRTLLKVNRDGMKQPGISTTEFRAWVLGQSVSLAGFLFGADPSAVLGFMALNQSFFSVCRGVVKKKEATNKTTVYSI